MQQDEILDLVNELDEVIGNMPRNEVYAKDLKNYRVINCFIRNKDGKLWIPRRTANKKIFPLALDMSCGGHVSSGETYEEAFRKEMSEELNIDVDKTSYRLLGKLTPKEDGVGAFMYVYEITSDEAPDYNHDDYVEYFWLSPKGLLESIAAGEKTKDDLPKLVKRFYL